MRARALVAALASVCAVWPASALESAQWPPPPETAQRMQALQHAIIDPQSTPAQREAAREELAGLLKSPAGQTRGRTPDEKPARAARAAIDPFPSVVKPFERVPTPPALPSTPSEGVARIEVIEPPRPVIIPRTGTPAFPTGNFAIDPNGHVLHPVPGGYIDPRTGQLVPR